MIHCDSSIPVYIVHWSCPSTLLLPLLPWSDTYPPKSSHSLLFHLLLSDGFFFSFHIWETCNTSFLYLAYFFIRWCPPFPFIFLQNTGFILIYGWKILHCAYTPYFPYQKSFVDRHLGWFHIITIMNSAKISMGIQVSPLYTEFISFGYKARNKIARSCGHSLFSFLSNFHAVFIYV